MKLVILHHYSDGYTYSGTDTIPIERDSEEALLCELEDWAKDGNARGYWKDTGIEADTVLDTSKYCSIEIFTLDNWFDSNKEQ